MSQTRAQHPISPTTTYSDSGVTIYPDDLSEAEVESAKDLVLDGILKPVGIQPLVDLLIESGLDSRGFLGCVLAPYGKTVRTWSGVTHLYSKTVPVWAVQAKHRSSRNTTVRGVTYLNTKDFVSWLKNSPRDLGQVPALPAIPESPTVQQPVALPAIQVTPVGVARTVPVPSTAGVSPGPPPSYVSELGDIRQNFSADRLAQLESEFRSTPRLNGGREFDNDEYFRRLDALNDERRYRGLAVRTAPTPSTYQR